MTLSYRMPRSTLEIETQDGGSILVGGVARTVEVDIGGRGPQGVPGPTGGSLVRIADGAISGHRVVRATSATQVGYCDAGTLAHMFTCLGVTTGAAANGAELEVTNLGELIEPSWSWTAGLPIFCGAQGVLTQTYDPAWAWCLVVAVAETSTKIFIQPRTPIAISP